MTRTLTLAAVALLAGIGLAAPTFAQSDAPAGDGAAPSSPAVASSPYRKPPPGVGAPGGRVGGASRGLVKADVPWPTIEPLAPADHTGLTAEAAPTLFYFVSSAVPWTTQLTISAPLQARPVLEVTIPSPTSAGIYYINLSHHRVRLDPGIVYTWSVAAVVEPRAWSRNIVGSATIERVAAGAPAGGVVALAQAGLWYDAIAAAAQSGDGHAMLDAMLDQVGLAGPARFDRAGVTASAR